MQEYLNCYAVEFHGPLVSERDTYFIVSETLEAAIAPAKTALASTRGSEAGNGWQLANVREIARGVIIPTKNAAKKRS